MLCVFCLAENKEGIHRSDVIGWYLGMIEDKIESEDDLIEMKELVEKVLDRLIYHVGNYVNFKLSKLINVLLTGSNYHFFDDIKSWQ